MCTKQKSFVGHQKIKVAQLKGDSTVESLGTHHQRVSNWLLTSCTVCGVPFIIT